MDLIGGYRVLYDPAPALRALEERQFDVAWEELWSNLHHQGDVGTASYVAVPEIVRIAKKLNLRDWNAYGLVAVIEECRLSDHNPPIPVWLEPAYFAALNELAEKGLSEYLQSTDVSLSSCILSILAFNKGLGKIGSFALLTSDEQEELLSL